MLIDLTVEELARVPIFSGMRPQDIQEVTDRAITVYARKGINLVRQGEAGFDFFVVLDGTADVTMGGSVVATLGPGDVFGEMALMEGGKRVADVVATSAMRLATMMVWDFREMTKNHPEVMEKLKELARARSNA
jgi:CPA1 family monovalent cation:H+ antiporter